MTGNWQTPEDFLDMNLKHKIRGESFGVQEIDYESSKKPQNKMQSLFSVAATKDFSTLIWRK